MCLSKRLDPDVPDWVRSGIDWGWKHRNVLFPLAATVLVLATVAGVLIHRLTPTDMERAEADLHKSWSVVNTLEEEAPRQLKDWREHNQRAIELRKLVDENKNSSDLEWFEWQRAKARGHAQLAAAADERRDHLLRLAAEYRRLIVEARCEILRAKDARERGTPYEVAPRVRELLKPILTNH